MCCIHRIINDLIFSVRLLIQERLRLFKEKSFAFALLAEAFWKQWDEENGQTCVTAQRQYVSEFRIQSPAIPRAFQALPNASMVNAIIDAADIGP